MKKTYQTPRIKALQLTTQPILQNMVVSVERKKIVDPDDEDAGLVNREWIWDTD